MRIGWPKTGNLGTLFRLGSGDVNRQMSRSSAVA